MRNSEQTTVRVSAQHGLPRGAVERAQDKIGAALRLAPEPVLDARVRLTRNENPAVAEPVTVHVNIDVNGRLVRVSAHAGTAADAIDLAEAKLRQRFDRVARHWEARCGAASRRRAEVREPRARRVIPHEIFTVARSTVDDAAFEMDMLEHDFHVFTEQGTGVDSVLYRLGPTGYRLAQVDVPQPDRLSAFSLALTISSMAAPALSTEEAVQRLELTGWPFVFYLDAEHTRGTVLYHRADGHYGLISPAG